MEKSSLPVSSPPLAGIKVLDLTRYQAGPSATRRLADYGCEVVKVEMPGVGDPGRIINVASDGFPMFFEAFNRNKKSVEINLRDEKDRDFLFQLVKWADVLVENYKFGTLEKWGLGYNHLQKYNEKLIYASSTGYGPKGRLRHQGAFDMASQAWSGAMCANGGGPSHKPRVVEWALADEIGGMNLAFGVLTCIIARNRTGKGQHLQTSQLGAMIEMQVNGTGLTRTLHNGKQRDDGLPPFINNAHRQTYYQASDNKWFITAVVTDKYWKTMLTCIGRQDLLTDPRQFTNDLRSKNSGFLKSELSRTFSLKPRDYWVNLLTKHSIVCAPVLSYAEVKDEQHFYDNRYLRKMKYENYGEKIVQGLALNFSETKPNEFIRAPKLGEHNYEYRKKTSKL
eukprot:g8906.t1